jgi:hypothetical protein
MLRVLLLPLLMSEPAGKFVCSTRMFFAAADAQTYHCRVIKLRFFPLVSSIWTCLSVA